ncbi:alpha/beta hydrolase family protein [Williamsia limnetica]|uniref:Alpha/beta hydrolase family protein n=1 Tax=Williamsia limnetica TaxID=882452 RepID=A0A318RKE4_WILLI|nr:alpha/beta hydrolase family protein [Williamsia limnetica]
MLYLFGGGFVGGIGVGHWWLIGRVADVVGRVEVPLYGLAPDFHHDDALSFLVAVYDRLMTERPGVPVVVMADSSGGALAVLLTQAVRGRGMAAPIRLILLCPWLDLSLSNPGIGRVARRDPWLSRGGAGKGGTGVGT